MPNTPAFKKLQVESAKNTIIDNLKITHQSKLVNFGCAIRGIGDNSTAVEALNILIANSDVTTKLYPVTDKFGSVYYLTMYRYNFLKT